MVVMIIAAVPLLVRTAITTIIDPNVRIKIHSRSAVIAFFNIDYINNMYLLFWQKQIEPRSCPRAGIEYRISCFGSNVQGFAQSNQKRTVNYIQNDSGKIIRSLFIPKQGSFIKNCSFGRWYALFCGSDKKKEPLSVWRQRLFLFWLRGGDLNLLTSGLWARRANRAALPRDI